MTNRNTQLTYDTRIRELECDLHEHYHELHIANSNVWYIQQKIQLIRDKIQSYHTDIQSNIDSTSGKNDKVVIHSKL